MTLPLAILVVKEQEGNPLALLTASPSEGFTGGHLLREADLPQFPSSPKENNERQYTTASAFKEKECCMYRQEAFAHISNCPVYFSMPAPHLDQKASTCEGDAPQCSVGYGAACASATE